MKRARIKQSDRLGVQIFVVTWVTLSIVFSFVPLYVTILNSLKPHSAIAANIFSFAISFSAIRDNFTLAFNSIWRPMLNSIFVAFVGAFLNMMLGAVMAYIFSRKQFFGREFLFKVYIVILLVPSVMGMPVLLDFITKANLMNSYFAIWLPVIGGGQAGALFLLGAIFRWKWVCDPQGEDGLGFRAFVYRNFGEKGYRILQGISGAVIILCSAVLWVLM